jgi:hypothetical protein
VPSNRRLELSDAPRTLAPIRRANRERVIGDRGDMGNRADFIIVEDQDWQLYYSHWGGCRMLDALIGGPDLALRYAASLRRCEKNEWSPRHGPTAVRW